MIAPTSAAKYVPPHTMNVFVNALHYIKGFDGQAPIARKASGTMMRSSLDAAIHDMSPEGYQAKVATYRGYAADEEARRQAEARARTEANAGPARWLDQLRSSQAAGT